MGLAKKLDIDQSSFSGIDAGMWVPSKSFLITSLAGSFGWKAPEVLRGGAVRLTKAVDVFSLGCLIYYILTKSHPFGEKYIFTISCFILIFCRYEREFNILNGRSNLRDVSAWPEAYHLIKSMICTNPEERYVPFIILQFVL